MATRPSDSDSEEEVRHKPTERQDEILEPKEMPQHKNSNYDILLIGHTGYGKSTTADKLMVPNSQESLDGQVSKAQEFQASLSQSSSRDFTYQAIVPYQTHRQVTSDDDKNKIEEYVGGPYCETGEPSQLQMGAKNPHSFNLPSVNQSLDIDAGKEYENENPAKYENLTGWVLSDDPQEVDNCNTRLKNVVFCRDISNDCEPHIHIQKLRDDPNYETTYSSSKSCQLLTNDDSKIRVLDTPGFSSPDLMPGATNVQESNLAIVRHIVRIQALADLKVRRVLYFLPVKGALERADRTINEELEELIKLFGRSIFQSMVLVATTPKELSIIPHNFISSEVKFPQKASEKTQDYFKQVLDTLCQEHDVNLEGIRTPPVIFIAMTDTCEEILHKIKQAQVHDDTGPQLVFNPQHCIKCGMEIGEQVISEYKDKGTLKWANAIAYNDSRCHPQINPDRTVKSVYKGLLGLLQGRWNFTEERCVNKECKKGPGTKGCKRVNSTLRVNSKKNKKIQDVQVVHSFTLDKL